MSPGHWCRVSPVSLAKNAKRFDGLTALSEVEGLAKKDIGYPRKVRPF
jgi:hypothetical protein